MKTATIQHYAIETKTNKDLCEHPKNSIVKFAEITHLNLLQIPRHQRSKLSVVSRHLQQAQCSRTITQFPGEIFNRHLWRLFHRLFGCGMNVSKPTKRLLCRYCSVKTYPIL